MYKNHKYGAFIFYQKFILINKTVYLAEMTEWQIWTVGDSFELVTILSQKFCDLSEIDMQVTYTLVRKWRNFETEGFLRNR